MKFRLFFILLFAASVSVSAIYFLNFLGQHPSIGSRLDAGFVALIIVSIILQLLAHYIRAYKSKFLLDHIRESKASVLFQGVAVGDLFNSLLPFRLGEIIRAFYAGDALSISKTTVFMSIVIERLVDGIILGLCFITAGLFVRHISESSFMLMTKLGVGLLVLSLLLSLIIQIIRAENRLVLHTVHSLTGIFNPKISSRLRFMAWSGIYGTRSMLSNKYSLRKYYAASLLMWLVYFCSTVSVAIAFFGFRNINKLWFITQASYAGVSTPAGPGYVGTFHLVVSRLLMKIGIESAGGFALFLWLIITVPISCVGLFVLVKQRFDKKQEVPKQQALMNKLHRDKDVSEELSQFLDAYLKGEKINQLLSQAELDGKFKLIKSFKGGSNAHTMLVWQDDDIRVKKISLIQFAGKLEEQAKWLIARKNLDHLPRVIHQEKTEHYYYFDLAYYENFVPFFDYIHSQSSSSSFKVVQKVLRFLKSSIYIAAPVASGRKNVDDYIDNKVIRKINDTAAMSSTVQSLMTYNKLIINGTSYDNILQVIEKIRKNKKAMAELSAHHDSPIHGDLTVDNLIVSPTGDFLLLDPNNENQVSSPVVDFGNLYQSLHSGYEFLIQLEDCRVRGNRIDFEDSKSQKYGEILSLVDKQLKRDLNKKDYRSILFHEAVQYCRMLTYRVNINPATVPVFYATAVKLFNEFLDQYKTK